MFNAVKHLSTVCFSSMQNWSVQYSLNNEFNYTNKYPLVKIGSFLFRNKTPIEVEDSKEYKRVTIKINNGGVLLRDIEKGKNIGTKKQYLAKEGQFIFSRIDARNGAFGIIPEDLEGAIVTNDFPVFDIDPSVINIEYLVLVTTTKEFVKYAQASSSGTTNRQRINIDIFLNQTIPLPALNEQDKIVEVYNKRIKFAEQQEKQAKKLEEKLEDYLLYELGIEKRKISSRNKGLQTIQFKELSKWALSDIYKVSMYSFKKVVFDIKSLREIITFFDGGKTPSTSRNDYWGNDVFWTSAKDMKEFYLKNIVDKISFKGVVESNLKIYPKGTILAVFRSGILRHSFPICITTVPTAINQDIKAIGINENAVSKLYFTYYLSILQSFVLERSQKKGVTVESINTSDFMTIPIVCPSFEKQNEIVEHITNLKEQINILNQKAEGNRKQAIVEFENTIFD